MHRIGIGRSSLCKLSENGVHNRIQCSKMSSQKIDRGSRAALLLTGAVATAGGTLAAAAYSPKARDWLESNVPGSNSVLDLVIGPKGSQVPSPVVLKPYKKKEHSEENDLLKKKLERDAAKMAEAAALEEKERDAAKKTEVPDVEVAPSSSLKLDIPDTGIVVAAGATIDLPLETPTPSAPLIDVTTAKPSSTVADTPANSTDAAESSAASAVEEPAAVEIPVVEEATAVQTSNEEQEKPLQVILKELESKASAAVTEAVRAQDEAAIAIRRHTDLAYQVLDKAGEPAYNSADAYGPVADAAFAKVEAVKAAEEKLQTAREMVAQLKELVASGVKNRLLIQTPDLIMADEAAARALYNLESARAKVQAAESDARIMDEYRGLVEKARSELQHELSSILPEVSTSAKGSKLTEEELNMLMAHAYRKIVALQKELSRQQTLEQQRFLSALEIQRHEDLVSLNTRIRAELEKQERDLNIKYNKQMAAIQKELEAELHGQLKRQAAAHAEHVTDLLATQEKDLNRKWSEILQDHLTKEQLAYETKIAGMIGQIKGIERAIKGRVDGDVTFHRAQRLWSACQALVDAVTRGPATALSWEQQVTSVEPHAEAIRTAAGTDDTFVSAMVNGMPEEVTKRGVLPLSALKERFLAVERVAHRVALVDENGGSLVRYILSYLQSMFIVNAAIRPILDEKEVDPEELNTYDILVRAKYCLEKDDLEQAIRFVNLLRGEPRNVARDWLNEARLSLEVRQTADALLTYACANGIQVL